MGVDTSGMGERFELGRGGGVTNTRSFGFAVETRGIPSAMDMRSTLDWILAIMDVIWLCIEAMTSIWFCIALRAAAVST